MKPLFVKIDADIVAPAIAADGYDMRDNGESSFYINRMIC